MGKSLSLIFLISTTALLLGDNSGRKLTLEFPRDHSDKSFTAGESISFSVVLHALNVEDRNQFEGLVIDDWRYDTPNYFTDHRSPNVVFHIERFENSRWEAVGFRVSSQSGGANLEKDSVEVDLSVGGDERIQQEELRRLLERAKRERTPENDLKKQLRDMRVLHGPNKAGRYRITATYTGLFKGSSRLLLTTGPVEVTVNDAKP
jgi:hypothetical protein